MLEPHRSPYAPIVDRPVIRWPGNARVAVWVAPNIEFKDFMPEPNYGDKGFYRSSYERTPLPDIMTYGSHDYGNRVCFWRMLEVFDQNKIRCTVSLNHGVLDLFPELRDAMVKRDYDFMSHGIFNNRYLNHLSIDQERAFYKDCVESLKRHTGKTLKGMLTPGVSPTENTPDLMAEAGLIYNADWGHDDQPFPMKVKSGRLISMPYNLDLNDGTFQRFGCPPKYWAQCVKDQFDVMYAEGAENATQICVSLHPALIGHPSRIDYLNEVLSYIMSHDGVWQTTADDIAQHYMDNYYDTMVSHLEKQGYCL